MLYTKIRTDMLLCYSVLLDFLKSICAYDLGFSGARTTRRLPVTKRLKRLSAASGRRRMRFRDAPVEVTTWKPYRNHQFMGKSMGNWDNYHKHMDNWGSNGVSPCLKLWSHGLHCLVAMDMSSTGDLVITEIRVAFLRWICEGHLTCQGRFSYHSHSHSMMMSK